MSEVADSAVAVQVDLLSEVHEAEARAVWSVTDEVFGDHASYEAWWTSTWDRHATREGFRLARARLTDDSQVVDDRPTLVGFAYGYTGQPRQWWTDRAAQVLRPEVAATWLGGHFEVVSVATLPTHRGRGLGARLLRTLTDGLPHERRLLMTSDDPGDPARRLYARQGWRVIGPGFADGQAILGWVDGSR